VRELAITRIGQQANSVLALDVLLQKVGDDIQQLFRYDGVIICLLNEKGEVVIRTASGGALDGIPAEAVTFPIPGQLMYIADVRKNGQYRLHLLNPDIRSSVSIPLSVASPGRTEEKPIGMLSIQDKRVDAFTPDDLGVLQILARQIAVAIHNAQLFEETQQANKAKTNFISYISHEIRNPVNSILALTESMLDHPELYGATFLPDIYRDDITDIDQNATHLKKLLSDVLDLTKIEAGRMEMAIQAIDPLPILHAVQQYAEGLLQPEVLLLTNYPEQLPHVLADDLRLNQVLMNLVGNAVKFTKRGSVTISVQAVNRELLFSICDTGPGIPRETLTKLFNAYTQGAREIIREYGGTGLGLNISKQFVELHRGRIWAESEIDRGTTFHFTIPLAGDE
jgi:signal transduction histidine kinase